jgi:uncharacterized membrane protein YkoI
MFRPGFVTRAALTAVVGLALGHGSLALAQDDRPLPSPETLAVGLDDAVAAVQQTFPTARVFDASVSRHGDKWVYMVKTLRGSTLRTIKYDCSTGQRIVNKRETVRGQRLNNARQQVQLLNTVATTKLEAIQAAEAAVPGAKAYEVELDDLNDQPVFKVKLLDGTRRVTVIVSAGDGSVMPQPGDGVVNLSLDDAATTAEGLFPGWSVVKVELDDDRDFDDSGSFYNLRLVNSTGTQRRDVKLNANTGGVRRDRISDVSGSNAAEFAQIAAANPAISFGAAGKAAADSINASRIHEVQLKIEETVLVYEVELFKSDGTTTQLYVNATTGEVSSLSPGDDGSGGNPGGGNPGTPISSDDAVAIALARFPGSTLREVSTGTEHGAAVYEVSLIVPGGTRTDVKIDQSSGAIVKIDARD